MEDDRPSLFRHRFGSAEFDEARFELRVGGLVVEVQQKPLQLLALLLASPGEVVGKEQIFETVWHGRATGDAVLANAVSKLRSALGADNAERLVTVPRQGYRLAGPVERTAVGRRQASRMDFAAGAAVPRRENFVLVRQLGGSAAAETWLARHARTGERRVYKFAVDGERLAELKREVTLYRVLREALGERPDIARILDWQFDEAPYFLECADDGTSLDAWADEAEGETTRLAALPPDARLALALQVIDAVAAAHGVGVLHKDLKPANILVARRDPGWQLRLTDFGSGRLLDPQRLESLRITQLGLTLSSDDPSSGTPFYLAPELVAGAPPSVRSDVYALGVMLYQLLCADLKRVLAPGWERDVVDEQLRDDIARATDLEPEHRLGSAAELALRLRSLEARRAERAAQQRDAEQAQRAQAALARSRARRPWMVAAGVALMVGAVAAAALYLAERRTNRELAEQIEVVEALNTLLREHVIAAANPAVAGRADVSVATALKTAASGIDQAFGQSSPRVRASLHQALQNALSELSQVQDAVVQGQRAVDAFARAEPRDLVALQDTRLRLGVDLVQLSRLDEAVAVAADIERDAGPASQQPAALRARLLFLKSWLSSGDLSLNESLAQLREAWRVAQPLGDAQLPWREKIQFALADNLTLVGEHAEAEALFRELLASQSARHGDGHVRTLVTRVGLGKALANQRRFAEAAALLTQAAQGLDARLGAAHRMTLSAADQLAEIHFRQGEFDTAAKQWQQVHAGFAALLGEGSSYAITVLTNLAMAQHRSGRPALAEPLLRRALAQVREIVAADAPQAQQIRFALAECLLDLGRGADAARLLDGLEAPALNLAQQESDWPQRLQALRARLPAERRMARR